MKGFYGFLTLLFVGLKLAGVIHWSWWWVLAPLWAPVVLTILIEVVGTVIHNLRSGE